VTIVTILTLLFGSFIAFLAAVYCVKADMIARQAGENAGRTPRLLHIALPIRPQGGISASEFATPHAGLSLSR